MLVVGITGGLATGKTTVAEMFKACSAYVIDADVLARQVVEPGKPAWREIVRRFGPGILNPDKTLDRAALAQIVFRDPRKLKALTDIIHPRVARAQAQLVKDIAQHDPSAVVVYDAALLIEAGAHRRMDKIIVVKADRATQIARACRRNGLSKRQAERRIRNQMPLRQKLRYADYVIDGTLPLSQLRRIVKNLYRRFKQEASCRRPRRCKEDDASLAVHRLQTVHARQLLRKKEHARCTSLSLSLDRDRRD
ncbi:MAG: dephospho-CoA kinase [Nitrospirae bacterium]|nr:MAG: dephospho-CoA kinase [Nitrospirota bacterium]